MTRRTTHLTPLLRHGFRRALTSCCRLKPFFDPERLAAQMARDLSPPVPKKKPKQEWRWPQTGG